MSRGFSENERNPNYERHAHQFIKKLKGRIRKLILSTCPKRRIRERVIRDCQIGEC